MPYSSSESDVVQIAQALLTHLNNYPLKPCTFKLESLDKSSPSLALQQMAGTKVKQRYVNGSYIGVFPFAITFRVGGEHTKTRINASEFLNALDDWLIGAKPYIGNSRVVNSIELITVPAVSARYENGVEDWQSVFALEYKQGGKLNV